jgi:Resolvase, N terminal domain
MAAEANAILQRQHAAVILARQAAMREVKRRRQKQGIKGSLPHSTLARLAIEHLQDHPHLLAEAAADPLVQILGNSIRRRRPDPKRELHTDGQSLESRHSALTAAGATQVFSEKISGVVTDRKALGKALAALGEGDVLLVTRKINPRPPECLGRGIQSRCRFSVLGR